MNIYFDKVSSNQKIDRAVTAYGNAAEQTKKAGSVYTVDISGTVMDNNAYTGHGKTAEDVMQEAGTQDLTWQRNYMAVMSNSMSDEDFARLQEEGFHPGSTEIETVVTIVDQIKAVMAQSGVEVTGYTDTLDRDTLIQITGDQGLAEEILEQFHMQNVPVTEENVEAVLSAMAEGTQLTEPSDGTIKYLIENGLEPTVDHLYLAEHSGAFDGSRQGRGYYDAGAGGYLAKKADVFDWQQLTFQIQRVMEEAGFEPDDAQVMEEAKWLLEKGAELTAENLSRMHRIQETPVPPTAEQMVQAATIALADGRKAGDAVPGTTESIAQAAARIWDEVNSLTGEAADLAAAEGRRLTLKNLIAAQYRLNEDGEISGQVLENLHARRQLEEVRLRMTVEANRMLLKSGFSIDTAPMEELVEALKQAEQSYQSRLFAEPDGTKAESMGNLYHRTMDAVSYLQSAPAAVVGRIAANYGSATISELEVQAKQMQASYEKAGSSYETLMTAPRADLGDSIEKAFRNVDDILRDFNLETTEDNRRAVRILGYNSMDISRENIELVKSADTSLQRTLEKMTPGNVLQMIRDGENPLSATMEELSEYFDGQQHTPEQDAEKYSKFLYKMEKNGKISEEERTSFIGIYRMIRTLEKNDGAAIGALVNQGAELTFQNLLSAVRSRKKGAMDYQIDDSFGGLEVGKSQEADITSQIQAAYTYADQLLEEIYEKLSPELLQQTEITQDMTLEQAAEQVRSALAKMDRLSSFGSQTTAEQADIELEWVHEQAEECRQAAKVQEGVLETLLEYGQPVTPDNLAASQAYLYERGSAWRAVYQKGRENGQKKALEEKADKLTDRFDSREEAGEAYTELAEEAKEILGREMEAADTYTDVRQMMFLYKQISFCSNMAKEENYEIPVSIGGETTSIHLKIRSADQAAGEESGKVSITCQTERFGSTAGVFSVKESDGIPEVTGYIACEREEAAEYFSGVQRQMQELLQQNGMGVNRIQVISGGPVRLERFERPEGLVQKPGVRGVQKPDQQETTASKTLYQTAKLFLTAVRNAERG